ncbi:MAG: selenocysteine-specific translation elongation factor [Aquificaceae bacterium]|nr:selenocysteine-specific translation elongation factor [Aquificaceae bacterium]
MKYFPIGVAGHVDHGKTSLVRALTSIDTDRLPEEKLRGMSIDIGFAFLDFPQRGLRVEVIDIPGHERFIKNAICGLAVVWGVLLVVDASEGVMPQTVEHLKVAKSFGIEEILVALTKSDRVDAETIELAKMEVLEVFEREGFKAFGLYAVSSLTGYGIDDLKEGLGAYAEKNLRKAEDDLFRFYVDSAFSVKGYGTVLRGSCVSGKVLEGDTVYLEPLGIKCKVRKMQNHGIFVKEGRAGERLAINVSELEPKKVQRGYFLTKGIRTSNKVIARLQVAPKGLCYVFLGMCEVAFHYRLLHDDIYLLRLSEPVPAVRGDVGPVLNSEGELVGQYEIIHPLPVRTSKKFIREHLAVLLEKPLEYLLLERGVRGLTAEELFSFFGRAVALPQGVKVGGKFYHPQSLEELSDRIKSLLSERAGILPISELKSRLGISEEVVELLLRELKDTKVVEGYLLDTKKANLEELEGYRELINLLSTAIREEKELEPYKDYLAIAVKKGDVYSLGDYLYVSRSLFEEFVIRLRKLGAEFSLQQAKESLKLTRKYLIPILEHMDRMGITKRQNDKRVFYVKKPNSEQL